MQKIARLFAIIVFSLTQLSCMGQDVTVGAARHSLYLPELEGKRIALFSNQTGIVDGRHTLDILLEKGLDVRYILSPEHGFRGTADAGEGVGSSVD